MLTYILVFAAALAFAMGGTPMARRLAHRTGMTDAPTPRKVHLEPMPLLGGIAIYGAVLLAVLLLGDRFYVAQLAGILMGATLMSFLGLWDDRRPLRPAVKLAGQLLAALVLVASGVQVALFGQPLVDGAVTVLWVVAVTNALNFLDNMDGLSGGVAGHRRRLSAAPGGHERPAAGGAAGGGRGSAPAWASWCTTSTRPPSSWATAAPSSSASSWPPWPSS